MQAAKVRGTLLGSSRKDHWKGREQLMLAGQQKATRAAAISNKQKRLGICSDLIPLIKELKNQNVTLQAIAAKLNELGHVTRRNKSWDHVQVLRLLKA